MADHRAEQIMDAVATLLAGLATTGSNITRDRVYPIEPSITAALSLYMGVDDPAATDDQSWFIMNTFLNFRIDIQVAVKSTTVISQTLNQIRKEITIALQADPTLSLGFVVDLIEGQTNDPVHDYLNNPVTMQSFFWSVHYERSRSDPSA
jgi:hypothetical protein